MKILKRYILTEFLRIFLLTTVFLTALSLMVDVVEKADEFINRSVPAGVTVTYFLLKIPNIFQQILPVCVLLSVFISLGLLSRNSELTAIRTCGVRLISVFTPLMVFGILASLFVILFGETLLPLAHKKVVSIERRWLDRHSIAHFGSEGAWFKKDDNIYNIRKLDSSTGVLEGVNIYTLEKPFRLVKNTAIKRLVWKEGGWQAEDVTTWYFTENGKVLKEHWATKTIALRSPDELIPFEHSYENMTISELRDYINSLTLDGYDTARYRTELYMRLTLPFANLVMVLLGIPFSLRTGRESGLAAGIVLSIIIGFSYWIVTGIARTLGETGTLPPLVCALFPDVLFLAIGVFMFGYIRE